MPGTLDVIGSPARKPLYRVYRLDQAGHISYAEVIEAIDDEEAIRQLRELAACHDAELWDLGRFVARSGPKPGALQSEPTCVCQNMDTATPAATDRSVEPLFGNRRRFH